MDVVENVEVELMRLFCEASTARANAVRNGDLSEAWNQTLRMRAARMMAKA